MRAARVSSAHCSRRLRDNGAAAAVIMRPGGLFRGPSGRQNEHARTIAGRAAGHALVQARRSHRVASVRASSCPENYEPGRVQRHMTKAQLAMVAAKAFPEAARAKRRDSCAAKEQFPMVDSGRLAKARIVLAYAPELVGQVIAGTKSLDAAYDKARNRKKRGQAVVL